MDPNCPCPCHNGEKPCASCRGTRYNCILIVTVEQRDEKARLLETEQDAVRHWLKVRDDLMKKLEGANLQNSVLREMVQRGLCEIGGWREMVATLDDLGKPASVGSAMWAALDQMDRWRSDARKAVESIGKRSCVCAPEGAEFVTGCKTSTGGPCPVHDQQKG